VHVSRTFIQWPVHSCLELVTKYVLLIPFIQRTVTAV
jgi:hypothetical protein